MKINFIVPSTSTVMGGGIRVIFRHANYLADKGHDVVVYVPMLFYIGKKFILKTSLANTFKRRTRIKWMETHFKVKLAFTISDQFIRDADLVIATAWYTAHFVNKLSVSKGKKVYFIQDYEIWNQDVSEVDSTYKMNMHRIVITKELHDLFKGKFGVESEIVYNGHSQEEYITGNKKQNDPLVVMMLWNSAWYKGSKQALSILDRFYKRYGIKVRFFSVERKPDLPNHVEFYHRPERSFLMSLYRQSDIYLFPSNQESWGLPIIEAMANKCAVVGMNTGALRDVCEDGVQALIAENGNYKDLEEKLEKVICDDTLRKQLQNKGYNFSLKFSWDKQCLVFEQSLLSLLVK